MRKTPAHLRPAGHPKAPGEPTEERRDLKISFLHQGVTSSSTRGFCLLDGGCESDESGTDKTQMSGLDSEADSGALSCGKIPRRRAGRKMTSTRVTLQYLEHADTRNWPAESPTAEHGPWRTVDCLAGQI